MALVFCPVCDRTYSGATRKEAELEAREHVTWNHPEYELNPFLEEED